MNIQDNTSHERKISCTVGEKAMLRLVVEKVAREAGFDINAEKGAHVRAYISESGRGGTGSIERNVRVELTQDLLPDAGPSTIQLN
ncbi:hypothetical protein J7E62_24620 [Variovorax paradoxus]|nr:hypothetical protein [Variovorax paradoxus]